MQRECYTVKSQRENELKDESNVNKFQSFSEMGKLVSFLYFTEKQVSFTIITCPKNSKFRLPCGQMQVDNFKRSEHTEKVDYPWNRIFFQITNTVLMVGTSPLALIM